MFGDDRFWVFNGNDVVIYRKGYVMQMLEIAPKWGRTAKGATFWNFERLDTRHYEWIQRTFLVIMLGSLLYRGTTTMAQTDDSYVWERLKRVSVVDSDRRVRYASITRGSDRSLLTLFTRQDEGQEASGSGDLVLVRSTDDGQSWSDGTVIYSGTGEPRALGTMTTLRSGQILTPFTELSQGQAVSRVHLLVSDDDGHTWQVRGLEAELPLIWWAPCGKIIEASNGSLIMPVFGAESKQNLEATIHGCGLLRSSNQGATWDSFTWIARGPSTVHGASPGRRFSFEGASVQILHESGGDPRWVAIVTARRLNRDATGPTVPDEGPGAPLLLCRLWSTDEGRNWSCPDQLSPGAWPAVTISGQDTLCAVTNWSAWGDMNLMISRNAFKSFFQMLNITTRGWIRGRTNNPHEVPLPPTVPYLAKEWAYEHYGFASMLALNENNVVVVFNRPQRGELQIEGDANERIPWEHERIQAVFYRRVKPPGAVAPPPESEPTRPHGRWVLVERFIPPHLLEGQMTQGPDGRILTVMSGDLKSSRDGGRTWEVVPGAKLPGDGGGAKGILKSGRWLVVEVKVDQEWKGGKITPMGDVGGYPTFKQEGGVNRTHMIVWRSDDEGKTWKPSEPYRGPFKWASPSVSHFIESSNGVVCLPIFGPVTDQEMSSYSASNGIMRSHDGGESWSDFSFIFRTRPPGPDDYQSEPRYSEMDVVQLPNGHWVAYSRNERITMGPTGWGATAVALSTDEGSTWQATGGSLVGVSQQQGVVLPGGGIALTYRSHSWQQPGVAISYDEGRSFDYLLAGPYETVNAFMHGENEFIVFTTKTHRSDGAVAVYRWTPDED